ncbi:MAG TPA: right-handed parallel beta-helix repeat-containing protein, partial [Leptolyngbyaceae cyanobacterium]
MKTFIQWGCVSLLWVIAIASTAKAQTPSTESTPQQPPIFTPRIGVRYTTEGAGFDSFTSLEGFLPLLQNPGNNLTFLQGAVQLDNNSTVATNVLLGHRFYNDESNRVTGGYISYSTRDTGESNFDQLGLGFESLGNWDVRFNAYLPLNSTENQLTQFISNQGSFQGTSLLLPRTRLFEVALSGVDAEVGTRLTKLGNGDLRGYAGVYYYSGGDSREAFGWKTRVEARPTDFLGLSLSVQNDQLFDTRVVFSIGANFPGSGATRSKPNPDSALARMAETVERQATILVADETRNDQIAATVAGTGTGNQTLTIIHVAPGGNSDGSFESPFGTIGQAVAIARPGNIIYVRSGDNTPISSFTIPDGVQVLSSGPVQVVNTGELGIVQLPLSGSGRYPTVTGTVSSGNGLITLGNNTVLSGFNIQVAGGNNIRGIQGRNISNVTIRDNRINNATGEGIYLQAVNNSTIVSNTISNSLGAGIQLNNVNSLSINNNNISNSGSRGIQIERIAGNSRIISNTINNSNSDGISLSQVTDNFAISNNTISQNNANAIAIANTTGTVNLTLAENQIRDNFNSINLNLSGNSQGTVTIDKNSITNPGNAVDVTLAGDANFSNFTISNNQITAPTENISSQGINFQAFNNARVNAGNINNNIISNTKGDGITIQLNNGTNTTVNITGNTISGVQNPTGTEFTDGIDLQIFDNATSTVNIAGNNIFDIAGRGVSASNLSSNSNNLRITDNNQIRNTTEENIGIDNFTGTIEIANNTVSNSAVDGIKLTGTSNATIQNNTINNSANRGIRLENTTGNTIITNNTVSNSTGEGISLSQTTGTVAIANNTVSNSAVDGIKLTGTANATIQNNTINNSGNQGIRLENATGNTTITNNTVSKSTGEGISLSQTTGTVAINKNNINNNNANAIAITNTTGTVNLTLAENQIKDNFNSINLNLSGNSQGTVTIDKNNITNPGNAVDVTLAGNANFSNFTISNNQITAPTANIPSQGINFQTFENARVNAGNINNNTISNTQGDGINVGLNQ